MNSHISRTSTFSAPVVQSRLEHHHQQQMLNQTEARNQFHQRSKSLNKGKRGFSYNHQQKVKETSSSSSDYSRNSNRNFSNYYSNNFDSSYHRELNVGYSNNFNNNFLVDNGSVSQLQRKTSTPSRPSRRHHHSDSVDEDKFRVIPTVSILKRPQSATDFVKSSNSKPITSLDVTKEEQIINHHRPNSWEKSPSQQRSQSKERRRSDVTPSRSNNKQAQRKEIRSMEFETDLLLNSSTIQLSGSGDESDVNSNKYVKSVSSSHNNNTTTTTTTTTPPPQSNNTFIFPPLNYSNAIIALEEEMNSNNKKDTYCNSDDNILVKSSKKRSDHQSTPRRLSSTAIELQSQVSRFASDSDSDSSTSSARPSSSPGRLGVAPKLYAGPTFHNSPAPSDLPMPSFYGKSLSKESSPLSVNNLFTVPENTPSVHSNYDNYSSSSSSGNTSDDEIFSMDEVVETPTLRKQKSQDLLRILSTTKQQTAAAYMVPERMATAHHPMHVYPSNDLNELSETLRSLLKIHGQ